MTTLRFAKVVANLPGVLDPDTLYLVRAGAGFDLYVSDATGSVAYVINPPPTMTATTGGLVPTPPNDVALVLRGNGTFGVATNATNAANLTGTSTANIPTSALGSGTANDTTFLRGDRAWVSMPSDDIINMDHTAVMQALSLAHMAHEAIEALRFGPWQQRGEVVIRNRGVVSGCAVTKSTNAVRNLNIAAGVCFAGGLTYPVIGSNNAASVPANTSMTTAVVVSAYLYPHTDGQTYRLAVTAIGQAVPNNGIEIYRLTIPANNTDATDPNLTNVTLTDVRRIEANFPNMLDSPPTVSLAFARPMRGTDWRISLDVVSATGIARADDIRVTNRATNGCTLTLASAADDVRVRYLIERLTD